MTQLTAKMNQVIRSIDWENQTEILQDTVDIDRNDESKTKAY